MFADRVSILEDPLALKTQPTKASVTAFINAITDDPRRRDCQTLVKLMGEVTREKPKMWGASIVGFGSRHYKYETGREGDWFLTGFSPRKQDLTLYIIPSVNSYPAILNRLGKHKTGVSCLYIKKLADVDLTVLRELIETSVR